MTGSSSTNKSTTSQASFDSTAASSESFLSLEEHEAQIIEKLDMCYETLNVKDADETADDRMEQSGESQARNDIAVSVSALEAAVEKGKAVLSGTSSVFSTSHMSRLEIRTGGTPSVNCFSLKRNRR